MEAAVSEKTITRENFRARLRLAHGVAQQGTAGIIASLVEYEGYPKQMDDAALAAAAKFEEAAMMLRRAVALVIDPETQS
jgi:hypothetical protein